MLVQTVEGILSADADFNISILNIDGLVEGFSEDVLSFDMGKVKMSDFKEQAKVLIITTDKLGEVKQLLDSKSIEYVEGINNDDK